MNTRQYARLVDEWVTGIGLPIEDFGMGSKWRDRPTQSVPFLASIGSRRR
jgi:hypothetical protein